jgi:hypothetical protein
MALSLEFISDTNAIYILSRFVVGCSAAVTVLTQLVTGGWPNHIEREIRQSSPRH